MTLNDLLSRFKTVKQLNSYSYQVSCPAHADNKPSLTITEKDDKFLLHCKAGCETESIVEALGLNMRDLFKGDDLDYTYNNKKPRNSNIKAIYPYEDEAGDVVFEKVRFKEGKGTFRHTDSEGNVIWSISKGTFYETYEGSGEYSSKKEKNKDNKTIEVKEDIERVLYNLPALIKAKEEGQTLYIAEGEKDVETLRDWGLTGTTNFDGGGKDKFKKRYGKYFLNADVVVIPDCDKAGRDHQRTIVDNMFDIVKSIKVIELPNVENKKGFDLTDYKEVGHSKEDFLKLVDAAKEAQKNSVDKGDKPSDTQTNLFIYDSCYMKYTKDGTKPITDFIISLKEMIVNDESLYFNTIITGVNGIQVEKTLKEKDFLSKKDFKCGIGGRFSFKGTDDDIQDIKTLMLQQKHKEYIGVNYIGFNKAKGSNVFITDTKAIDEDLKEVDDVVITDDKTVIRSSILETDGITKEELKGISPHLLKFNKLEVTSSILGTISTMLLKERLKDFNIKTQHLMMFGEAGAGKSQTLENIVAPFFSYDSSIVSSAGMTKFTSIKNITSSNTIPLLLEEYKPSEMSDKQKDMLLELFRNIYDEHSEQRGNRDQTITDYPLLAPIVAVGEEQVEQTAVIERSVITTFSKLESEREDRTSSYLHLKENRELIRKLGRSILNIAMKISSEDLKMFTETSEKATHEVFRGRVRQNVANTLTGMQLIVKLYEELGLDIEDETGVSVKELIEAINKNAFNENLEGASSTKTIVDNTLELIDVMAGQGILKRGIDYTFVNNGSEVALRVNSFYHQVTAFKQSHCIKTSIVETPKQFVKMLKSTAYYLDYKNSRFAKEDDPSSTQLKRAYVLSANKLREKGLELESLVED